MKTKVIFIIITSFLFSLSINAQRSERKFDVEKHKQEQAKFFIKELDLTEKEQKEFIPLMQEFIYKRFELNREVRNAGRELRKNKNKASADYQKLIDLMLDTKIEEAQLQKEYYKKFGKVLPADKVLKYHSAEMKFMETMVKKHRREKNPE